LNRETGSATRPGRSFTRPAENISIPLAREVPHLRFQVSGFSVSVFSVQKSFPRDAGNGARDGARSPKLGLKLET
jgi:hypothetical protein